MDSEKSINSTYAKCKVTFFIKDLLISQILYEESTSSILDEGRL